MDGRERHAADLGSENLIRKNYSDSTISQVSQTMGW